MKKYLLLILTLVYVAYSNAQELNIHVQKISWSAKKNGQIKIKNLIKKADCNYIIDLQNKKMDVIFNYDRPSLKGIDIQVSEMNGVYTIEFDDLDSFSNIIKQHVLMLVDLNLEKVQWNNWYQFPGENHTTETNIEFLDFDISKNFNEAM